MSETRRHVLVWVAPEFLQSAGMIQILEETGLLASAADDLHELLESVEEAGGIALAGWLGEIHHGAGVWISPTNTQGLELMIPWHFVRSVVTAEDPKLKIVGLIRNLAQGGPPGKKTGPGTKA